MCLRGAEQLHILPMDGGELDKWVYAECMAEDVEIVEKTAY